MRRPDFAFGRIECYGFCVGNVVAKLRGFAAMHGCRRQVQAADGEFGATELLDGFAIVFATLLGGFFDGTAFESAIRFVAGDEDVSDVGDDGEDYDRRIQVRIFQRGFLRNVWIWSHGTSLETLPQGLKPIQRSVLRHD